MMKATHGDEARAARRWDELKMIQDTLTKVWQAYMIWSIWFLTALYGTIAYVAGFDKDNTRLIKSYGIAAASTCIILDIVAVCVTVALFRYTCEATDRADHLGRTAGFHSGISPRTLMAAPLLKLICCGFLISYVAYIGLWVYLLRYPGAGHLVSALQD